MACRPTAQEGHEAHQHNPSRAKVAKRELTSSRKIGTEATNCWNDDLHHLSMFSMFNSEKSGNCQSFGILRMKVDHVSKRKL
jgi:hypothetical protein